MADLIRSYNWRDSSLGPVEQWPKSLKAKLNTLIFTAFPVCLFWGEDLIFFYNDAFRKSLGDNGKHPAIGKKAEEVWKENWPFLGTLIRDVMETGNSHWFEDRHFPYYRNGKIEDIYWTFSCSAVTNEENQIGGVLFICTETTEKVKLLHQLQETTKRFAFAIDASDLSTWDYVPSTQQFFVNDRFRDWWGIAPDEPVDLGNFLDRIDEYDKSTVLSSLEKAMLHASGGNFSVEFRIINHETSKQRTIRAKGRAIFDADKNAERLSGTMQDISNEFSAVEEGNMMTILVENSVDLMAILNLDGKNRYINKAGKKLLGIDEHADVSGIPITDFHTPEQFEFVSSEIIPNVMQHGRWSGEFGIKQGGTGEIIPLYNNCHRIDDHRTGQTIGIGAVMRDMRSEINARHLLEEKVHQRTQELQKLNAELEIKNKELRSFAFISSHDLQEPLRKICTFISLIQENGTLDKKRSGYLDKISQNAVRMRNLINDLLTFSRTDQAAASFQPCNLRKIIEDIRQEITENNGEVNFEIIELPETIPGIEFQLRQLFSNLFSNAVKFRKSGEKSLIRVHTERMNGNDFSFLNSSDDYIRISVTDNGIGFQQQYSELIFEVFQRLHNKSEYEGTGVGLAICKKIMENHNGYITAEGKPNEGAAFHLIFPAGNLMASQN